MKYIINLIFGKASSEALLELQKYILNSCSEDSKNFLTNFCVDVEKEMIVISEVQQAAEQPMSFLSSSADRFLLEQKEIAHFNLNNNEELCLFIDKLWRTRITANHKGDKNLGFCLYLPLYDEQAWHAAQQFVLSIEKKIKANTIDIIGFANDLATIFVPSVERKETGQSEKLYKSTVSTLKDIVKFRKEHLINNFFVVKNQTNSYALDFNLKTLTGVLAEFSLMCVENYDFAFGRLYKQHEVEAMGLSIMLFDKFYFTDYLLARAFLHLVDQEKIKEDKVDLSWCANEIDRLLRDNVNIMSNFYDNYILYQLNQGKTHEEIMPEIRIKIDEVFNRIREKLIHSIVRIPELSLPRKKALLAALLGEDDELFGHTTLATHNQIILMDLEREYLTFFITENNSLVREKSALEDVKSDVENLPEYPTFLAPINETGTAELVTDEIKNIRYKQRNLISDIRRVRREVETLEKNLHNIDNEDKCLVEGGKIIFKGREYKLLPHIEEVPLQETYVAHSVTVKSVDLSGGFTNVKNQGSQGACVAFTFVGIFEYFMKQNAVETPDLSEQFLYYNARKLNGDETKDEGSYMYLAVRSLVDDGICLEDKWSYDSNVYDVTPSEDAYADAMQRKVRIAKNVELKVDDIRSALSDGFPVAISIKLFNGFGKDPGGLIQIPSEREIEEYKQKSENHSHAMIICGYNDDQHLFKVRNSWGADWGDNGFCYLPYEYMENNMEIAECAMVIQEIALAKTEVSDTDTQTVIEDSVFTIHLTNQPQLRFSEGDIKIQYVLYKNQLQNLIRELQSLTSYDKQLRIYYESLRTELHNSNYRVELQKSAIAYRERRKEQLKKEKDVTLAKKQKLLYDYKKRAIIRSCIISIVLLTISICLMSLCNIDIQQLGGHDRMINQMIRDYKDSLLDDVKIQETKRISPILISQNKRQMHLWNAEDEKYKRNNYSPLSVFTDDYTHVEMTKPYYLLEVFKLENRKGGEIVYVYADKYGSNCCILTQKEAENYYRKGYSSKPAKKIVSKNKVIHEALLLLYPRSKWMWLYIIPLIFLAVFLIVYFFVCYSRYKEMQKNCFQEVRQLQSAIKDLDCDIQQLPIRFSLAGEMLNAMFELTTVMHNMYSATSNILVNLQQWQEQISSWLENAHPQNAVPFISIQSNEMIEAYFDENKERLFNDVHLYKYIENHCVSEENILLLQQQIRKDVENLITEQVETFNIVDYILRLDKKNQYKYLCQNQVKLDLLLEDFDKKADVFVEYDSTQGHVDINQTMFLYSPTPEIQYEFENKVNNILDNIMISPLQAHNKIVLFKYMGIDLDRVNI